MNQKCQYCKKNDATTKVEVHCSKHKTVENLFLCDECYNEFRKKFPAVKEVN